MKNCKTPAILLVIAFAVTAWAPSAKSYSGSADRCNETSISIFMDKGNITSYPNPVSGQYSVIEFSLPAGVSEGKIELVNTNGEVVKEYDVSDGLRPIYVSSSEIAPGQYMITLETTSGKINEQDIRIN